MKSRKRRSKKRAAVSPVAPNQVVSAVPKKGLRIIRALVAVGALCWSVAAYTGRF
jgi:hypothetical protein